jgi:phenylalanyl-tRNA synthetase alpha chain
MSEQIEELKQRALQELQRIDNVKDLEAWRVRYLGKKSLLTQILRGLAALSIEEKKEVGTAANQLKAILENSGALKEEMLRDAQLKSATQQESIDISLPGRPLPSGRIHPITQVIEERGDIVASMGFQVAEGPDVEWDYYNFEALNMPAEHPARDNMSSFWIEAPAGEKGQQLLRTHTTAITARTLEKNKPPIRAIEPGWCYRYEATDATTSKGRCTSSRAATSASTGKYASASITSRSSSRGWKWPSNASVATAAAAASVKTRAGWRYWGRA